MFDIFIVYESIRLLFPFISTIWTSMWFYTSEHEPRTNQVVHFTEKVVSTQELDTAFSGESSCF